VLGRLRHQSLAFAAATILLVSALPWSLWNISRSLAPRPKAIINKLGNRSPFHKTIIEADRVSQYFTNRPTHRKPFLNASLIIRASGAKNIGLKLAEDDWEYPLWVLLNGATKGPRMEHIDVQNLSGAIEKGDFQPDLIVKFDEQGIPAVMLPTKYGMEYTKKLNGEILRE
jgi:hypothetical protein